MNFRWNPAALEKFAVGLTLAALSLNGSPLFAREFDLLIRDGLVVDGTGGPIRNADIGIDADTIVSVGRLADCSARRVIEARGLIVTPGFIDMHAHCDDGDRGKTGLRSADPRHRAAQNYVTQGVTTVVVNPDGDQPPSLVEQRRELNRLGIGLNAVLLNGHNTLREQVMGKDLRRPANAGEIAAMQAILRRGLEDEGSFGLSLGLEYYSGLYSDTKELVALARVLPAYNGIFIPHLRSQGIAPMWYKPSVDKGVKPSTLEDSINEVIEVGEETGATVELTHMKAWGPGYRGEASKWIARLQAARDRGVRLFIDVYPYESSGSDGNFCALPSWALGETGEKGADDKKAQPNYPAALRRTLEDRSKWDDLRRDVENQIALKGGPANVRVLAYPDHALVGRSFAELMAERHLDETRLAIALQLEGDPHLEGGGKMRSFSMDAQDIEAFYRQPWCATSSDGWILLPEEMVGVKKYFNTNQRCFGTFPRRIAVYSQDRKADTLEQAVRKSSGLPAEILHLVDRGRIEVGLKADLAVIDLARLRDNTTVAEPSVYASGVEHVFVNGVAVVSDGKPTLALPGRVLDPPGHPAKPTRAMTP